MLSVECGKYTSHFAASKVASLFSHRTNIPRRAILLVAAVGFLTVTILPSASLHAELSDAQQRMANNLKTAVKNAGDLYKENKFSESAAEIKRAQRILDNLTKKATQDVLDEINSDYKRMQKAHKLLGEKGMKLDPMKSLPTPVADTAPAKKPKKNKEGEEEPVEEETSDEPEERPAANEKKSSDSETKRPAKRSGESEREERTADVSFTKQVAPVLVRHCGQCHIDASKGDISFANYQAMMDGPTIVVSDPDESSLVQEIESGKMPPKKGGKPVPAASLILIRDWVKQGAKFDGEDPEAGLKGIVESSASAK